MGIVVGWLLAGALVGVAVLAWALAAADADDDDPLRDETLRRAWGPAVLP